MKHLGTKKITTDRLILREFTMDDTEALFRNWASDPEVTKYLMWPPHKNLSISHTIMKDWVQNYSRKDYYQWAIVLKENGPEPIGCIGVNSSNDTVKMAHIGYCIGKKWWHQGITSEALQCVIDFLFDRVGMQRIESRHDPKNPNSGAVMKKCNMRYEGTLRMSDYNNQGICDADYYSILASDRNKE